MATSSNVPPTRKLRASACPDEMGLIATHLVPDPIANAPGADIERLNWPHAPKPFLPLIQGYELLEELGRGGMGIVYKARQRGLNRLVALKLILAGDQAGREEVARFFHEAEAIGALRHPNIVQVYEVGEHDGRPYLSLEYVEGGTLLQRIQDGPQAPAFATEICETVARAVHVVHSIHIVHRDLKPANILLQPPSPDPVPPERGPRPGSSPGPVPAAKITDFGLAKRLDTTNHLTETGTVAGTPTYMAPEQARGDRGQIGPAADIWAIGVILYEMLAGRPPFHAACPIQMMSDVLFETPVPPRRLVPGIPRDLETICLKCLEKSPARRYSTALDLADDLRRFREGRPILARRVGAAEQMWRWCARNPVVAGLLAGILAVFATGASVAAVYAVRADENAREAQDQQKKAEESARDARAKEGEAVRATAAADAARLEEARQKGVAAELAKQATAREARGVRERYALDANLALKSWEAGDLVRPRQFLARYTPKAAGDPDLRGFEWYYLDRLCRSELQTIPLGADQTRALAFFPDGRRFAFGRGNDFGTSDPERGVLPVVFRGHTKSVSALACNPRTAHTASASCDGTVRVWDAETGKVVRTLRGHADEALGVAYTPDGRTLISCGGRHSGEMKPGEVIIWDLESGRPKHTLRNHQSAVNDISLSGDGKLLASCGFDGFVHLYDVETGAHLRGVALTRPLLSVAIHPGKKWFVAGSDRGPIAVCDLASGTLLRELHSHSDRVNSLACSADGSALASGGLDATVRVWNPETGELLRNFRGHVGAVRAVRFMPNDDKLVSVADDGVARVWDVRTNPEYTVLGTDILEPVSAFLTTEPAGLYCVRVFGQATFRDVSTGRLITSADSLSEWKFVHAAAMLPDGDTLALVRGDGRITYRSLSGLKVPTGLANAAEGTGLSAAANGRWLAVEYHPRWLHIHDLTRPGEPRKVRVPADVTAFAFGPGGDPVLAVATEAGTIQLLRPDGSRSAEIVTGPGGRVSRLAFSPDGTSVAGDDGRSRVHLWDVRSGKEVWCSEAHTDAVRSVAFSRRGDRIVTASLDRTAKILDSATGRETISLRGHSRGVLQALFTPDGSSVITVGLDSKLLRWEGSQPR
ncbi:MAG: hypothetical protein JWO38_3023 [Gemmataceae bacterium]|nr:hypothetical protein [Gemmataceae bacterium]